jgi:hypothetical protein
MIVVASVDREETLGQIFSISELVSVLFVLYKKWPKMFCCWQVKAQIKKNKISTTFRSS